MSDFKLRFASLWPLVETLHREIYPDASTQWLLRLQQLLQKSYVDRSDSLKGRDRAGESWYQAQDVVAMTLYTDLFAGDFKGVREKIGYFQELGINLIHFMPLLKPRDGENDGGYAVADYRNTDPRLGTMEEFQTLVGDLFNAGISSCVDFVINHTAKEHPWAMAARSGDPKAQGLYFMYDDQTIPKEFEKTVPQVFPGVAPGNFTWYPELKKWVFTSFYEYQWDLNYRNPEVLERILETLLFLGNGGISMIRLDAIPFIWKELGTSCRNLPTIHKILKILHTATQIVCPSVVLLGEAIVEPREIVKYFGDEAPECPVMYNATTMVNIWNSLATRDTRLFYADHDLHPIPPWGCWINYARCHDDIGWGFNESAVANLGLSPGAHKQFLIQFYLGAFDGSFSRGELYEFNPENLDARNSGTLASLCGLETALEQRDPYLRELALKRITLIHSFLLAQRGIPLIYAGDEIATVNDHGYKDDPKKAHDSRWLHRVAFDWDRAGARHEPCTPEFEVFQDLKRRIHTRKALKIFHGSVGVSLVPTGVPGLILSRRISGGQELICIFNFSEDRQFLETWTLRSGLRGGLYKDVVTGKSVDFRVKKVVIGPYESLWLVPAQEGK